MTITSPDPIDGAIDITQPPGTVAAADTDGQISIVAATLSSLPRFDPQIGLPEAAVDLSASIPDPSVTSAETNYWHTAAEPLARPTHPTRFS